MTKAKGEGASVRFNEDANSYELGAEVDGTFIVFQSIPGTSVEGTIASAKAASESTNGEQAAA